MFRIASALASGSAMRVSVVQAAIRTKPCRWMERKVMRASGRVVVFKLTREESGCLRWRCCSCAGPRAEGVRSTRLGFEFAPDVRPNLIEHRRGHGSDRANNPNPFETDQFGASDPPRRLPARPGDLGNRNIADPGAPARCRDHGEPEKFRSFANVRPSHDQLRAAF